MHCKKHPEWQYSLGGKCATFLCTILPLAILLSGCISLDKTPSYKQKSDTNTVERLLKLNDLNERSFAYHQHCLSKKESISETFLANFRIASNQLFDAGMDTGKWSPDYIVDHVKKRRAYIQSTLSGHYMTKGCQSPEARTALDHYRQYSQPGAIKNPS